MFNIPWLSTDGDVCQTLYTFERDKANIQLSKNRLGPKVHLLFLFKIETLLDNY